MNEFRDKVNKSIAQETALICIGYHLPINITLQGEFVKPVYFSLAKF